MKKLLLLPAFLSVLMVFISLPLEGQTSKEKVNAIRKAYAEAVERTTYDEPLARTEMGVTVHRNVPGIGLQNKKIEFIGSTHEDAENDYMTVYDVRLVRVSYNVAARNFYEEYLYGDKGEPLFYFCRYEGYFAETITKEEKRYYYDNNSLCNYSYKANDAETGLLLSEKNMPDLFEINNGKDYAEHLSDFEVYRNLFNAVMNGR